ncbi:MAG: hypothetical protein NT169_23500 [Chloroflexi bacterium]|nr:hypothetical protein [Chloroflexota bacterium]
MRRWHLLGLLLLGIGLVLGITIPTRARSGDPTGGLLALRSQPYRLQGDNSVLWDYLYHNAPGYDPQQEFVPNDSYTFRSVDVSGNVYPDTAVDIYILVDWQDLTTANVRYWDGSEHWVAMSWVKNITASFHNQASRTYDLWKGTIPAAAAGATVWYRIQVNDGSATAYLKANNGQYTNPLGQRVHSNADSGDDYSYTVVARPASTPTFTSTATATMTSTSEPTSTATPTATSTAEPTETPSPTSTATATPEPTSTATPTATSTAEPTATPSPTSTATATPEPT